MQIVTNAGSTTKSKATKANGKGRQKATSDMKPTLHLKEKQLATPITGEVTGMIATAAYFLAERRGFEPGHELEDWLTAEQELRSLHS